MIGMFESTTVMYLPFQYSTLVALDLRIMNFFCSSAYVKFAEHILNDCFLDPPLSVCY